MDPVDLGRGDNKGCPAVPQDLEGFNGLGLESLRDIDHEDCHVGQCPATCPEGGECMMAGRINKKQPGDVDGFSHCPAHGSDRIDGDDGRTDVLGNRSYF